MSKAKSPAFQFYPQDFLTGTADMSNAEVGAYIRMLCHQWDKTALPDDQKTLIRFCNGDKNGVAAARKKFDVGEDGMLRNRRLERTREDQENYKANKSEAGKEGAKKRWQQNGTPIILPLANGIANDSSASSTSSSPSKEKLSREKSLK